MRWGAGPYEGKRRCLIENKRIKRKTKTYPAFVARPSMETGLRESERWTAGHWRTDRQLDRQTDSQTVRQLDRQSDRQLDRQSVINWPVVVKDQDRCSHSEPLTCRMGPWAGPEGDRLLPAGLEHRLQRPLLSTGGYNLPEPHRFVINNNHQSQLHELFQLLF